MLVFIDESGFPHPNDNSTNPVILAVCIEEAQMRAITAQIQELKRPAFTGNDDEIKSSRLLTKSTFRRARDKSEFVEALFAALQDMPLTVFAGVMERPDRPPPPTHLLSVQLRFLLERINRYAESLGQMATLLFDGQAQGGPYGNLFAKFTNYLYRSSEGRALSSTTDAPYFLDSRTTLGIQLADICAGVVRLYAEGNLRQGVPPGDALLSAISRFYAVVVSKSIDQVNSDGSLRRGIYRITEQMLYAETP